MNGNCHLIFGTAIGTAVCMGIKADAMECTLLMSTCIIGSVFPDIDNPNSHIGGLTVPISSLIGKVSEIFGKTGSRHRGIFHDLFIYLLGFYLSYMYFQPILGFFIGTLSHLFLDMLNPSGIPFFFGILKIRLAKIISGSLTSIITSSILSIIVIGIGIYLKLNY